MEVIKAILDFLATTWQEVGMQPSALYGTFHLVCFGLSIFAAIVLCFLWKHEFIENPKRVVLVASIIVIIFEVYKQIVLTFGDGSVLPPAGYPWYIFPWQFCSTPMMLGVLAGLSKGKVSEHFMAYLSTYALFAGLAVMFYPGDVFDSHIIGVDIQTMVCHGTMIALGVFLFYSGTVKIEKQTILKSLPVFVLTVALATSLNTLANLLDLGGFNAFFINPEVNSPLPVYSLVHDALREWLFPLGYIISLVVYVGGFTAAAFIVLLAVIGIKKLFETDFDAEYAEEDAARLAEQKAAEQVAVPVAEVVTAPETDEYQAEIEE